MIESLKKKLAQFYGSKNTIQDKWIQGKCNTDQKIKNLMIFTRKEMVQVLQMEITNQLFFTVLGLLRR